MRVRHGIQVTALRRSIQATSIASCLLIATHAAAGSLEALMTDLAKVEERHARFVEERTIGILDEPLVTEGTLSYRAPDRLIRQDLLPDPAIYAIEGEQLRIVIDDQERVLALDQEPLLQAMVTPFRAMLAGDEATLNALFDLAYAENDDRWTVTLTPKPSTASRSFIDRIEIAGTGRNVERMDVYEQGGDISRMRLEPTGKS